MKLQSIHILFNIQNTKIFLLFGDCVDVPTTKGYYATMNQSVVVRNNLWDYLQGNEFKAIYEGYSAFQILHATDKIWIFKHKYNFTPVESNFFLPRALGWVGYKLKNSFEKNLFAKIYQKKANFSYPYLQKDRYFRPLNENQYIKQHNISLKDILIHPNTKPTLVHDKHHNHDDHHHAATAAH